jgi:hypothetical protein
MIYLQQETVITTFNNLQQETVITTFNNLQQETVITTFNNLHQETVITTFNNLHQETVITTFNNLHLYFFRGILIPGHDLVHNSVLSIRQSKGDKSNMWNETRKYIPKREI